MPTFRIGPAALKEQRLRTLADVASALTQLDPDEGIRVIGKIRGLKGGGFIFVTKTSRGFAINICHRVFSRKHGLYIAEDMGEIVELGSTQDVLSFLRKNAKKPLEAVRY